MKNGRMAGVAVLLGAVSAWGAAELDGLKAEYGRRSAQAAGPILVWCTNQLYALQARAQQNGNLNLAMAVRKETAAVVSGDAWSTNPEDGTPPEIVTIRRSAQQRHRMVMQPVWTWYRQQLGNLQRMLTQQGRVDDAAQLDAELTRLAMDSADANAPGKARGAGGWQTPWGGQVEIEKSGAISLKGPGKAAEQCAIAISPLEWPKNTVLQCEFRIVGRSGGLVLCQDRHDALALYWSLGTSFLIRLSDNGSKRTVLAQPTLKWKPGEWQDLVIEKGERDFTVRVDKSSALVESPPGLKGTAWGLVVHYEPAAAEIRNVRMGAAGAPAPAGPARRR